MSLIPNLFNKIASLFLLVQLDIFNHLMSIFSGHTKISSSLSPIRSYWRLTIRFGIEMNSSNSNHWLTFSLLLKDSGDSFVLLFMKLDTQRMNQKNVKSQSIFVSKMLILIAASKNNNLNQNHLVAQLASFDVPTVQRFFA